MKPPPLQNFQFNLKISLNVGRPSRLNPLGISNNHAWSEYGYMFWNLTFWCSLRRRPSPFSSLLGMFLLRNVPSGEERPLFSQANLRVRSIRKSGFRFKNPDFGFAIEREIRKRISTLRYLLLDFHLYRLIGKSEKGFEKLSLRTALLHAHA